MARKNHVKKLLIGISAIILIVISLFLIYHYGYSNRPLSVSGYSSLSISNVQYDGSNRIRIYGVANGAEQISINFNPSQLNPYLENQGVEATKSVTGSITLASQSADFNIIKDTSKNFILLSTYQTSIFDNCENHVPSGFTYSGYYLELTKKDCLAYQSIGTYSTFTGQHIINSNINFNIGGATGSLIPSSGNNVLTLNDGRTQIEWVGDLNNYNQLTSPFQYAILFQNSQYQKLIDSTSWNSYQTALSTWKSCMSTSNNPWGGIIQFIIGNYQQMLSCTNDFNNRINLLLADKTSTYQNSIGETASFTNNALRVSLDTPTTFPTFIITLDASSVGIVSLKGTPDITSCISLQNINSGDTTHPTLSVKNTGNSAGSFYGNIQCSGGASGMISETYFNAGETKNIPVTVTGQNTQEGTSTSSCTATVIDRKSGAQDTCGFSVKITYQSGIICTANSIFCRDSHYLRTCSSDGKTYSDSECVNGCVVSGTGVSSCSSAPGNNETSTKCESCDAYVKNQLLGWLFPSQKCGKTILQGGVTCVFSYLKFALVLLVFIFASLFGFGFFEDILEKSVNKEKTRKIIAFILSLLIAGILSVLTYFIFWAGVITFIIFIVIRVAIKFFLKK